MADLIGVGRCPIGCGSHKARYTLSAKSLAVATCNACNCQVFARSDRSDETLRGNIAPAVTPEPVREIPAADPVRETAPAAIDPSPETAMDPPKKKRVHGWGVLAGQEY